MDGFNRAPGCSTRSPFPDGEAMSFAIPGSRFLSRQRRALSERWLARRFPTEAPVVHLDRRRLYILPTGTGYTFGLTLFALLIGSMNYSTSVGFGMTFLLAGIGLLTMLHTHANLRRLELHFGPAAPVFAGDNARFPVRIDAGGRERWGIMLNRPDGTTGPFELAPGEPISTHLEIHAARRGRLELPRVTIESIWPLALFRVWSWLQPRVDCLVYPRPVNHGLSPERTASDRDTGGRVAMAAEDEDFAGLREYQPGDPLHRIAWKSLARSDRLHSLAFESQAATALWFDWGHLGALNPEQRLEQIAWWILQAEDAGRHYGLLLPHMRIEPDNGADHRRRCLETLALAPGTLP